jgi:DNA polymerase epsilon subunit 1
MLSVDLKVDRRFYLNSYKERGNEMGNSRLVRLALPRNRTRHHLYEIEVPESQYLANMKLIEVQRTDPDVEGLYETRVPLVFRAVAELGAVCKVRPDARNHLLSQPWELKHLEAMQLMNSTSSNKKTVYLRNPPKFLFLHYCFYRQQHVFSVWFPAKKEIYIIYSALAMQTDVSLASLNTSAVARDADVKFADLRYETTLERAMAAVDSTLTKLRTQMNNAPTVLILQGPLTSADLRRNLPALDTMPQLRMSPVERDNAFPTFKWLPGVCNIVAARTLKAEAFFDSLVPMSRYSQIPLCNFPPDRVVYATDILLARRLRQNDMLLWYSDSGKPDIGGHEEEDSLYCSLYFPDPI